MSGGKMLGFASVALCILAGIIAMAGNINVAIGLFFIGSGLFYGSIMSKAPVAAQAPASKPASAYQPKTRSSEPAKSVESKDQPEKSEPKPEKDNKVAIYAGNLSPEFTEEDVRRAFEPFGTVGTVNVVMDKPTGKCKGFAFVEMPVKEEAIAAIDGLNGHELAGRELKVSAARSMPRPKRPRRRSKATA